MFWISLKAVNHSEDYQNIDKQLNHYQKERGRFCYDVVHPWQESAGMSYDTYLKKYQEKLAIMGGLCVQTTIGFDNYGNLENEIRGVFNLLKGKRWLFCTTHFVQDHCSIDELVFAFDLAVKLAREN